MNEYIFSLSVSLSVCVCVYIYINTNIFCVKIYLWNEIYIFYIFIHIFLCKKRFFQSFATNEHIGWTNEQMIMSQLLKKSLTENFLFFMKFKV